MVSKVVSKSTSDNKKAPRKGLLNLNIGGPCRARTYDPLIKRWLASDDSFDVDPILVSSCKSFHHD